MNLLEHLITNTIRTYFKNRLYAPVIYLVFLGIFAFVFPIMNLIAPYDYTEDSMDLQKMYQEGEIYGNFKLYNLYFTGYTKSIANETMGYYYYTMYKDDCVIVLLDPYTCDQGKPIISALRFLGAVLHNSPTSISMLGYLATDLNWNTTGIMETVSDYCISEPDANSLPTQFIKIMYIATGLFAIASILTYSVFIAFPQFCPAVLQLWEYGKPSEILEQVEEEIATAPQLVSGDMYITEHFFAQISKTEVSIVPLAEILWIYKYAMMHNFGSNPMKINYNLYLLAGRRQLLKCPISPGEDVDGIMEYLSAANPEMLVDFTEETRKLVKEHRDALSFKTKIRKILMTRI